MRVIGVVGLGYVGLPLAVEFGKKVRTVGFDLSDEKVESYRRHVDPTGEVSTEDLKAARLLEVTTNPAIARGGHHHRRGADTRSTRRTGPTSRRWSVPALPSAAT
jgi:UDP-N-acetyl-D-mannosaminuronate dehydrogenase